MKTRDDFGSRWLEKHWFSEAITTLPRVLMESGILAQLLADVSTPCACNPHVLKRFLAEARMLLYSAL